LVWWNGTRPALYGRAPNLKSLEAEPLPFANGTFPDDYELPTKKAEWQQRIGVLRDDTFLFKSTKFLKIWFGRYNV
jgi:hypothetical protein